MTSWTAGGRPPRTPAAGSPNVRIVDKLGEWRIDHADTVLTTYTGKCLVAAANALRAAIPRQVPKATSAS